MTYRYEMRGWSLAAAVSTLLGCGRIGFQPSPADDAGSNDDARTGDAMPADGTQVDATPLTCAAVPCTGISRFMTCGARCFTHCRDQVDQATARANCQAWGGDLISIHDATEQACMEMLLGSFGGWFGLVQSPLATQPADGWSWLDDGAPATYFAWFTNEPNDSVDAIENGDEQCGNAFGGGGWNDDECTIPRPFMCAR